MGRLTGSKITDRAILATCLRMMRPRWWGYRTAKVALRKGRSQTYSPKLSQETIEVVREAMRIAWNELPQGLRERAYDEIKSLHRYNYQRVLK